MSLTLEKLQAKDREIDQQADEIAALKSKIWKLQAKTQPIEDRLTEASEESEKLAAEIRALDQAWPAKLAELGFNHSAASTQAAQQAVASPEMISAETRPEVTKVEPEVPPLYGTTAPVADLPSAPQPARSPQSRFAGNVISLAQRIKALQKTITR